MKLMLKMKQNLRWLPHNAKIHLLTLEHVGKSRCSSHNFNWLHYIIIVFDVIANHFKWLRQECITSVV